MDWVKRLILASIFASLVFSSVAQVLPQTEVEALRAISAGLGITFWNISESSCTSNTGFNITIQEEPEDILSHVACNCSYNSSTVCHVTNIELKGLNLTGNLPEAFTNLTFLRQLDLSRNVINGSLPRAFGQLRVTSLALIGNNLTGTIPDEIGDISTLEELVLEDNMLEGNLPFSLGRLRNLRRLLLAANNFNGTIPTSYGNLTNLEDFRIDGSTISGRIPNFIGNWTRLTRLDMQGTSLSGPIPDSISLLTNLTDLRISDLNASNIPFPNLRGMTRIRVLVLRNCSITGSIPPYITGLSRLNNLDLSFNRLNGLIPSNITALAELNYLFLSNNLLTGEIPGTLLDTRQNIWRDLSYNNFTGQTATSCQSPSSNLFASHSASVSDSISWCLRPDLPCDSNSRHHEVFVNCGGRRTEYEGNTYEEDLSQNGPSHYEYHNTWAYSTAGTYMGNSGGPYVAANDSTMISSGSEIYQTARLSAHSIRYYGRCLRSGSYTVRLYFAEIVFYDNATFNGLGKRLFDIAIQGEVRETDFDITREANGVRRGISRDYTVNVTGTTLEIHLYWRGKGTTAIPTRGHYGPLLSAIAVTPNFKVGSGGLSTGAIVGIAVASSVVVLALLILIILWKKGYLGGKEAEDKELRALDLQTGFFTLRQIKAATGNFDSANKIGEGGFGPVYKGTLSDGTIIAVKQLSSKSKQGNREFVNEIGMISALQHPNLVRLYGCCIEGNQLLLIYEYLVNNSLARALFGREDQRLNLDWGTRKKICIGIARGLAYLHEESRLKIVHRDIKATNVLLDKDLNAKISDFGLAKLDEEENTHISTRIAGTIGYMAPEYAMRGYLTDKADVYSFGIVLLEVVSGKSNTNYRPKEEFVYLLDWAYVLEEQGSLLELVDPILGSNYSKKEAMRMLNLSLLCANPSPTLRPSMSSVVSMLEGNIPVQAPIVKRDTTGQDARFKAFELLSSHDTSVVHETRDHRGGSMDGPWVDSSVTISSNDDSRDHTSSTSLLPDA